MEGGGNFILLIGGAHTAVQLGAYVGSPARAVDARCCRPGVRGTYICRRVCANELGWKLDVALLTSKLFLMASASSGSRPRPAA